eukprot:TRINITY_DN7322_c0_g1_i4.p1 TRINITY_DN7322_c0_g1~~TRINITY_DN7322_c0_g1_i4.p1  ORF type:complete len:611 (+),score=120.14 TRINITY_DN7322_c0_g1_i4:20-1852(+)
MARSSNDLMLFDASAKELLRGVVVKGLGEGQPEEDAPKTPSLEQQMDLIQRQIARLNAKKTGAAGGDHTEHDEDEPDSNDEDAWDNIDEKFNDNEQDAEGVSLAPSQVGSKLIFQDSTGAWLTCYKDILPSRATLETSNATVAQELAALPHSTQPWAFFMCAGGHFAGAIIAQGKVLEHKTFHRYVVRAKRGTVQSARDNKSATSAPKSAGAQIRRYNEAQLQADIRNILVAWRDVLANCSLIFHRTSVNNRHFLFKSKTSKAKEKAVDGLLSKDDPRIRSIPFSTNRPTLKEISRIYATLTTIHQLEHAPRLTTTSLKDDDVATAGGALQTSLPDIPDKDDDSDISTSKPVSQSPTSSPEQQLYDACVKGDLAAVWRLLEVDSDTPRIGDDTPLAELHHWTMHACKLAINRLVEDDLNPTPLHVASRKGYLDIVKTLLEHQADMTLLNSKKQTAYDVAKNKETRNVFRRFCSAFPEAFDYASAHVPSPLTIEAEAMARDKADKAKQDREKRRAKAKAKEQAAVASSASAPSALRNASKATRAREARAAAALARMQQTKPAVVAPDGFSGPYCSYCGKPAGLNGNRIFRRLEFQYCCMDCLKRHRDAIAR